MKGRPCLSALLIVAAWLMAPSTAWAHLGTGRISSDYQARVSGFTPGVSGVLAEVLGGDQRLQLTVSPPHVVIVLGVLGEPFLRFSPNGVDVNQASPTASSARVTTGSAGTPSSGTRWHRISGGHAFAWHENRLRPLTVGSRSPVASGPVATWSIPMLVDGSPAALRGTEWYATGPPVRAWLLLGAAVLLGAAAAMRLPEKGRRRVAMGLLVPLLTCWVGGWGGILLAGDPSRLFVALLLVYAVSLVGLVVAAIAATGGTGRMVALATVGALAATFTIPELQVFTRGYVLSALPAGPARALAALSFTTGVALVIVCVPAMSESLRDDPLRRRLDQAIDRQV